jgi:Zn-dependent peptidase ImmA (M78 family)
MSDIFAQRFKSARLKAGLSLQALADKINEPITKQAISKYEQGKAIPDSKKMIDLAKALDVKLEYFFRPARIIIKLSDPAYRKRSSMSDKRLNAINETVRDLIERYMEAENLLDTDGSVILPENETRHISSFDDVESLAEKSRELWNLGNDPIESLVDVLEDNNFKVALVEGDEKFDGLSCWVNDTFPVIISKKNCFGDRQRSNLAHELGHLLMNVEDDFDEEKAAMRFSAGFLVPRDVVYKELGKHRNKLNWEELHILKHKYGMSMQQWIYRAKDLGIITESHAKSWFIRFRQINPKQEPGDQILEEKPTRMRKIVFQELAENIITPQKAAELLACNIQEIRNSILGL